MNIRQGNPVNMWKKRDFLHDPSGKVFVDLKEAVDEPLLHAQTSTKVYLQFLYSILRCFDQYLSMKKLSLIKKWRKPSWAFRKQLTSCLSHTLCEDMRGRPFFEHFMLPGPQRDNLGSQMQWIPRIPPRAFRMQLTSHFSVARCPPMSIFSFHQCELSISRLFDQFSPTKFSLHVRNSVFLHEASGSSWRAIPAKPEELLY